VQEQDDECLYRGEGDTHSTAEEKEGAIRHMLHRLREDTSTRAARQKRCHVSYL
jgi:hypothetical protein